MPLKIVPGMRLGPFEIVGWIGGGGMGDVYRARDPRLARDVAIKVIASALASDPDRRLRFEQEARTAGQLNHPNILAVFDVGRHDATPYIVSELLEGESLRARLQRGAVPMRKAVDYGRQIALGLAAAHDRKIVHRDIKPENLFVTIDERIKILDFGIAKLTQATEAASGAGSDGAETAAGTILGTTSHMSPEQLRGETVDARSDIFSLGTILYELLTGHSPFARATQAETVAAVLKEDPVKLPPSTPPALSRIVERCLEKAREARFQSARDLSFALEGLDSGSAPMAISRRFNSQWLARPGTPWLVAAVMAMALATTALSSLREPAAQASALRKLTVSLGSGSPLHLQNLQFGDSAAFSPREEYVAFVAEARLGVESQLYLRRLDQWFAKPLPGTEKAIAPFWSTSGEALAFFSGGKLKQVAFTGGTPVTLADAPSPRGGSWSEDGTIVFSPDRVEGTRLMRVSGAAPGRVEPVSTLVGGEVLHSWPQVLPGGRRVLYTATRLRGSFNDADIVVQDLPNGPRTVVLSGGFHGRYVETGRGIGHLVYVHDGTLMAVGFDPERQAKLGTPAPVVEGVNSNDKSGGAQFSLSPQGTLIYQPSEAASPAVPIHWLDREGRSIPFSAQDVNWLDIAISPTGNRIALEVRDVAAAISIYDVKTAKTTRLRSDSLPSQSPVGSPHEGYMAFASPGPGGVANLWLQVLELNGSVRPLADGKQPQHPTSWRFDGSVLAFEQQNPDTGWDLMMLPLTGSDASGWTPGKPYPFLNTPASEREPMFSPDGHWVAFEQWNAAERASEVWVTPFPRRGTAIKISNGVKPTWSHDELFYSTRDGAIMAVPYTQGGGSFQHRPPRVWSPGRHLVFGVNRMIDRHPDGRFVIAPRLDRPDDLSDRVEQRDDIQWIEHFVDELRRRVPIQ